MDTLLQSSPRRRLLNNIRLRAVPKSNLDLGFRPRPNSLWPSVMTMYLWSRPSHWIGPLKLNSHLQIDQRREKMNPVMSRRVSSKQNLRHGNTSEMKILAGSSMIQHGGQCHAGLTHSQTRSRRLENNRSYLSCTLVKCWTAMVVLAELSSGFISQYWAGDRPTPSGSPCRPVPPLDVRKCLSASGVRNQHLEYFEKRGKRVPPPLSCSRAVLPLEVKFWHLGIVEAGRLRTY